MNLVRIFRGFLIAVLCLSAGRASAQHSSVFFPQRTPVIIHSAPYPCPPQRQHWLFDTPSPNSAPAMPSTPPSATPTQPGTAPSTSPESPTAPSTTPSAQPETQANAASDGPQSSLAGTGGQEAMANPQMQGDFMGRFGFLNTRQRVTVQLFGVLTGPLQTNFPLAGGATTQADLEVNVRIPIAPSGSFKIAENSSPLPEDRVYGMYNYFASFNTVARGIGGADLRGPLGSLQALRGFSAPDGADGAFGFFLQRVQTATQGNPALYDEYIRAVQRENKLLPTQVSPALAGIVNNIKAQELQTVTDPLLRDQLSRNLPLSVSDYRIEDATRFVLADGRTIEVRRPNLHLETFGFEKTFFDGRASFGVRAPIFQFQGDGSLTPNDFGDLSFILKYAFLLDRETASGYSCGVVVTAPTGPDVIFIDGDPIHPILVQPFVGGVQSFGDFYVQGFSAVLLPTDSRDASMLFNDIGVGYHIYKSAAPPALLRRITPSAELHLTTPLTHRGIDSFPIGVPDFLNANLGSHFDFAGGSRLSLGVVLPMTGPTPYDAEALAQFNFFF